MKMTDEVEVYSEQINALCSEKGLRRGSLLFSKRDGARYHVGWSERCSPSLGRCTPDGKIDVGKSVRLTLQSQTSEGV
jgi:hypothetical protein